MGIEKKILEFKELKGIKKNELKIGYIDGSFDIFHAGHAGFIEKCKELVDILVVGVGSDLLIKSLKGSERPINPEQNRLFTVASNKDVNFTILCDEKFNYKIIKELKPNFLIIPSDSSFEIENAKRVCPELGIEIITLDRYKPIFGPYSSSEIIDKIKRFPKPSLS